MEERMQESMEENILEKNTYRRSRWNCYRAFTSFGFRLATVLSTLFCIVIGFWMDFLVGPASAMFVLPLSLCLTVLFDYLVFSGISARRQKCMEVFKSSYYGETVLKKALQADIIVKTAGTALSFLGCLIGNILYSEEEIWFTVILILAALAYIGFTLLITRRKGLNLMVQFIIVYLAVLVAEGITLLVFVGSRMLMEQWLGLEFGGVLMLVIMAVLLGTLAILAGWLLYKDCVKGYVSGFYENREG